MSFPSTVMHLKHEQKVNKAVSILDCIEDLFDDSKVDFDPKGIYFNAMMFLTMFLTFVR